MLSLGQCQWQRALLVFDDGDGIGVGEAALAVVPVNEVGVCFRC